LLDVGVSVNLIPFTKYERLELGKLKLTEMIIQPADRLTRVPRRIVEDVLIGVGEFIYPVDFVVIEIENMSDLASQVSMILGRSFLATANALINYRNDMMRLSFGNMAVELNFFSMQRQPSGFDDMKFSTLNWVGDSVFDHAFDDVFTTEYESFFYRW